MSNGSATVTQTVNTVTVTPPAANTLSVTSTSGGALALSGTQGNVTAVTISPTSASLTLASLFAPLNSPQFTGVPIAPTASAGGVGSTQIATTAYVRTEISNLIGSAPPLLDTLNEIADAINDDATFHSTVTGILNLKAPLANPVFTGNPQAPTPTAGDNDTSIATTAFVTTAIAPKAPLASPAFSGVPTAPTASANTNTTQIATTAFVTAAVAGENSLAEMDDVMLSSVSDGELIVYNSGAWYNKTLTEAGILPLAGGTMTGNLLFGNDVQLRLGGANDIRIVSESSQNSFNFYNHDTRFRALTNDIDIIFTTTTGGTTSELLRLDASASSIVGSGLVSLTGGGSTSPVGVNGLHLMFDSSGGTAHINAQQNGTSNRHLSFKAASYSFNSGGVTLDNNLTLSYAYPRINLTDTNNDSDYSIINNDGSFSIYDVTNASHRFLIAADGNTTFAGNLTVGDGHFIGDDSFDNLTLISSSGENVVIASANDIYLKTDASGGGTGTNRLVINETGATFDGIVTIPDGAANAPSLRTASHNSGLFTTSGTLQFSVDGVSRAYISDAGIISNGNVYTSATGQFRNYSGVWKATTGTTGNGFQFVSADATAMTLSSTGAATFSGNVSASGFTQTSQSNNSLYSATFSENVEITGILKLANGSVGAPTLTFTNDTDSGIYWDNTNKAIRFSIDGVQRGYFSTAGILSAANVYTGNTGQFRNVGGTWLATTGTAGKGWEFLNTAGDPQNTIRAAKLSSTGTLELNGGTTATKIEAYETYTDDNNYERSFFKHDSSFLEIGTEALGTGTASGLKLKTAGVDRITVLSGGQVGINTTTVPHVLSVKGTISRLNSSGIQVINLGTTSDHGQLTINNSGGVTRIALNTGGADSYINAGNFGVGVTNPASKLEVGGSFRISSSSPVMFFEDSSGSSYDAEFRYDNNLMFWRWGGGTKLYWNSSGTLYFGDYDANLATDHATQDPNIRKNGGGTDIGDLRFRTNNIDRMHIDGPDGFVGIGTTTPSSKLHVLSGVVSGYSEDTYADIIVEDSDARIQVVSDNGGTNGSSIILTNVNSGTHSNWAIGQTTTGNSNKLHIGHNTSSGGDTSSFSDTQDLVITTDGKVGIGTVNPAELLHVQGSNATINVRESGAATVKMRAGSVGRIGTYSDNDFSIVSNSTDQVRIKSDGKVGIGTTSPAEKLHVEEGYILADGASTSHGFELRRDSSDTFQIRHLGGNFTINNLTDNRKDLSIDGTGKFGIGTASPDYKLDVAGDIGIGDYAMMKSTAQYMGMIGFNRNGNTGAIYNNSYGAFQLQNNNGVFQFQCYNSSGAAQAVHTFDSSGNTTLAGNLTVQGDISTTGTFTIIDTDVSTTEQLVVTNDGTGPAAIINQKGVQPVVDFQDDGTSVFYIENGGNVGIGITDPTEKLEVIGDILINGGPAGGRSLQLKRTGAANPWKLVQGHTATNDLEILEGSDTRFIIKAGGNVGIGGVTNPISTLHLEGHGSTGGLRIDNGSGGSDSVNFYHVDGGNDSDFFITYSGTGGAEITLKADGDTILNGSNGDNVGIGQSSPSEKLTVAGNVRIEGDNRELYFTGNKAQIRASSANTPITFVNSSTELMRIDETGRVGIGTDSPTIQLYVQDSESIVGYFKSTTNKSAIAVADDDTLGYFSAESDRVSMGFNSGLHADNINIQKLSGPEYRVGIGTNSPQSRLDIVQHDGASHTDFGYDGLTITAHSSASEPSIITFRSANEDGNLANSAKIGSVTAGTGSTYNGNLVFSTRAGASMAERMRILSDGKVGIGTVSPNYLLDVEGSGANMRLRNTATDATTQFVMRSGGSSGQNQIIFGDDDDANRGMIRYRHNGDTLAFDVADAEAMRILSDGKVGINDTVPQGKLQIDAGGDVNAIHLVNSGQNSSNFATRPISIIFGDEQKGASARHQASINCVREAWSSTPAALTFKTATGVNTATERMRITSGGNVGIGLTSPAGKLDILDSQTQTGLTTSATIKSTATTTATSSQSSATYKIQNYFNLTGTDGSFQNSVHQQVMTTVSSTGTSTNLKNHVSRVHTSGSGQINNVSHYNIHTELDGNGTINKWIGYGIADGTLTSFTNTGHTITNTYGLYIGDITSGTQTNTPYGVYQASTDMRNYFGSNVGIGVTTPPARLTVRVDGNANTDQLRVENSSGRLFSVDNEGDVKAHGSIFLQDNGKLIATRKLIARDANGLLLAEDSASTGIAISDAGNTTVQGVLTASSHADFNGNATFISESKLFKDGTINSTNDVTSVIAGNDTVLFSNPVPRIHHDLLAFNSNVTQETHDGTSWSSSSLHTELFDNKEDNSITAVSSSQSGVRWTVTGFAYTGATHVQINNVYSTGSGGDYQVTIESSSDGTNWTQRHQSTVSISSGARFFRVPYLGGDSYGRITIYRSSGTRDINLVNVRWSTNRAGDQGQGREYERPYDWNYLKSVKVPHYLHVGNDLSTTMSSSNAKRLVVGDGSGAEGITIYSGHDSGGYLYFADGTAGDASYRGSVQYSHSTNAMSFHTAGTATRMFINSTGGIGLGTSSINTGVGLQVQNGDLYVYNGNIKADDINAGYFASTRNLELKGGSAAGVRLMSSTTTVLQTDSNGDVVIAGTTPTVTGGTARLTINVGATTNKPVTIANGTTDQVYLRRYDSGGKYQIQTNSGGGNAGALSLQSYGGDVGIGTTTPSEKLDVTGITRIGSSSDAGHLIGSKINYAISNTFSTGLTVTLGNHRACHVKIFISGDWSNHSSIAYVGEFFIQNTANIGSYNEPGIILTEHDNLPSDQIESKIVDGTEDSFEIQFRTSSQVSNPIAGKLCYHVMGDATSVS